MPKRQKRPETIAAEKAAAARQRTRGYFVKRRLYKFLRARGLGFRSSIEQYNFEKKYDVKRTW